MRFLTDWEVPVNETENWSQFFDGFTPKPNKMAMPMSFIPESIMKPINKLLETSNLMAYTQHNDPNGPNQSTINIPTPSH